MKEIEKKFLVNDGTNLYFPDSLGRIYKNFAELTTDVAKNGVHIRQGYLPIETGIDLANTLGLQLDFVPTEARLRDEGGEHFLTLKSSGTTVRNETPPFKISKEVFDCHWPETIGIRVEKFRLRKPFAQHVLEIDFYLDRELVVIEVETNSLEEAERFPILGKDITSDKSFKNKNLAK